MIVLPTRIFRIPESYQNSQNSQNSQISRSSGGSRSSRSSSRYGKSYWKKASRHEIQIRGGGSEVSDPAEQSVLTVRIRTLVPSDTKSFVWPELLNYQTSFELSSAVVPSRATIGTLKQSIHRQWPFGSSKPPQSSFRLRYKGHRLTDAEEDSMTIAEMLEEYKDDDNPRNSAVDSVKEEEEEEEDESNVLLLELDMIPPLDSKSFVQDLNRKIVDRVIQDNQQTDQQTDQQTEQKLCRDLFDAYCCNEAMLQFNWQELYTLQQLQLQQQSHSENNLSTETTDMQAPQRLIPPSTVTTVTQSVLERAASIRALYEQQVIRTSSSKDLLLLLLSKSQNPPTSDLDADATALSGITTTLLQKNTGLEIRGQRVRRNPSYRTKFGAPLDRNQQQHTPLTLRQQFPGGDWDITARNAILFLFFGLLGGRTPFRRNLLIAGAPAVILLRHRSIKRFVHLLLYFLVFILNTPTVLLTLLPSPYQSILSMNVANEMKALYGPMLLQPEQSQLSKQPKPIQLSKSVQSKVLQQQSLQRLNKMELSTNNNKKKNITPTATVDREYSHDTTDDYDSDEDDMNVNDTTVQDIDYSDDYDDDNDIDDESNQSDESDEPNDE